MAIGFPQQGGFNPMMGGGMPGQQPGGGLTPVPQQNQQAFMQLAIAGGLGDVRTQTFQTLQESSTQAKQAMDKFKQSGGQGGGG